jgi:hypothetical protein
MEAERLRGSNARGSTWRLKSMRLDMEALGSTWRLKCIRLDMEACDRLDMEAEWLKA